MSEIRRYRGLDILARSVEDMTEFVLYSDHERVALRVEALEKVREAASGLKSATLDYIGLPHPFDNFPQQSSNHLSKRVAELDAALAALDAQGEEEK